MIFAPDEQNPAGRRLFASTGGYRIWQVGVDTVRSELRTCVWKREKRSYKLRIQPSATVAEVEMPRMA